MASTEATGRPARWVQKPFLAIRSEPPLHIDLAAETGSNLVRAVLLRAALTPNGLAQLLGTSLVTVVRWTRGDIEPDTVMRAQLATILARAIEDNGPNPPPLNLPQSAFAARGIRRRHNGEKAAQDTGVTFDPHPKAPLLFRLSAPDGFWSNGHVVLKDVLAEHGTPAKPRHVAPNQGVSAGKNTYTYDAHTYHTKVPPQGIAEILKQYLPAGGLILDPFAGSGMTGVAARVLGHDVVLNELSPAASFIADRFTKSFDPSLFAAAVRAVCDRLAGIRHELYTTRCRTCGQDTEILYTVWSYRVRCTACRHEFLLWDHCRKYGNTVKEHKILSEFACPHCSIMLKKRRLQRTTAEPVLLGYKCCSPRQVEHALTDEDLSRLHRIETEPPLAEGFYPRTPLPDGVNLCQPKRHGLTSVDRFYTPRNLSAMSQLWSAIHHLSTDEIAGFLAFAFTSLYQRVTRLSEFRFWGGSGNTANFNVPYVFNEANVFLTFERKVRTIQDHLASTAASYSGRAVVHTGSATDMGYLPDASVDLVFTDPPFGANINYSEMNILWESWFGVFTDTTEEAIVNHHQHKDVFRYGQLMTKSLRECHRVLRPGAWMVLVFMNSSQEVWQSLRDAVLNSGFSLDRVDIFDKQHGTFKQFVSDNTAGCDLLLHCRKMQGALEGDSHAHCGGDDLARAVEAFLARRAGAIPKLPYLHVNRAEEVDYRMLYSEFLADQLVDRAPIPDFSSFRMTAAELVEGTSLEADRRR